VHAALGSDTSDPVCVHWAYAHGVRETFRVDRSIKICCYTLVHVSTHGILGQSTESRRAKVPWQSTAHRSIYWQSDTPQISKGLSQVSRLASSAAVQDAGRAVGVGPSVFNRVGAIAGSTSNALSALPGVAGDVRSGLTGATAALTPARRSIADLYAKANA
jgi:hypothetical protein